MPRARKPPTTRQPAITSFDEAVRRIRADLPPIGITLHFSHDHSICRDRFGMTSNEKYVLAVYDQRLKVDDEYFQIVATSPRELYSRFISEFLPAAIRALAPRVSPDTAKILPGQRTFLLEHKDTEAL